MNLGAKSAILRAAQMGSHAYGEGLRATPEFQSAMSLTAALNDPEKPGAGLLLGGWSCAVFGTGPSARFVIAERHGLSWIPAGIYLPAGVVVAHLDERLPAAERVTWRGLEPSALVLSLYAKAIGEQPRIVIARAWEPGLAGWFDRSVVLAADEGAHVIIPNPLLDPAGQHRLELAAPDDAAWVRSLPADDLPGHVRTIAEWLVDQHNYYFAGQVDADSDAQLRLTALAHIGRTGGEDSLVAAVTAKMGELRTRLFGCPAYGTPQWQAHTELEMQLRGWECLLLGLLNGPTHSTLADMRYAALMATHPILPMPPATAAETS
jgi:hypothetical protein